MSRVPVVPKPEPFRNVTDAPWRLVPISKSTELANSTDTDSNNIIEKSYLEPAEKLGYYDMVRNPGICEDVELSSHLPPGSTKQCYRYASEPITYS